MKLLLTRFQATDNSTIGTLAVDGKFECYTLEDAVRWQKIQDKTAIDPGTYNVIIDFSTRFQREMPHVMDVPNFTGIRIHPGNTEADTDGCILVGKEYSKDWVSESRAAFTPLYDKIYSALAKGETVTLEITEQAP